MKVVVLYGVAGFATLLLLGVAIAVRRNRLGRSNDVGQLDFRKDRQAPRVGRK